MRIMVFMKRNPAPRCQILLCALVLALVGWSGAHSSPAAPVPELRVPSRAQLSASQAFLKIEVLCPIVGLAVAIGATHFLQRRRNAQVQAWTRIDG